jgi:hypothetical protein
MMFLGVAFASELAEALLDAVEMVLDDPTPVGVVEMGGYVVATRSFNPEEALIIVFPNDYSVPKSLRMPQLAA